MLEPEEIAARVMARFDGGALAGVEVLVTAGPTREALDPVRFLTNHSTGKMGYAVAAAAAREGARVSLGEWPHRAADTLPASTAPTWRAPRRCTPRSWRARPVATSSSPRRRWRTTAPRTFSAQKIKKGGGSAALDLVRTPDIVAGVAAMEDGPFTVGFAAETESMQAHAREKLQRKGLDMIAANRVGLPDRGFASEDNAMSVLWEERGHRDLGLAPKAELARSLVGLVAERYRAEHPA